MALNEKQKRFVAEYPVDFNATQAAKRAGYSAKTAGSQGSRLLKHVEVQKELTKRARELQRETDVSAQWLLQRLAQLAEVDVADFYDENGALLNPQDMPDGARFMIAGLETKEHVEVRGKGPERRKVVIGKTHKVRFRDPLRVLDMLGKHRALAALRDPKEGQHDDTLPEVVEYRDWTRPPEDDDDGQDGEGTAAA